MRVGIPTEIKNNEYRVAITPAGVSELVRRGHEVTVQAAPVRVPPFTTTTSRPPARRSSPAPTRCGPKPTCC